MGMDLRVGLLAAALLLAGCGAVPSATDPASPPPSTTAGAPPTTPPIAATTGGVVPWADLPAAHETIPAVTVPASPDPAAAEAAPTCRADQVALRAHGYGAAMGTMVGVVVLSLAHGRPCALTGAPAMGFSDADGVIGFPVDRGAFDGDAYRHPVLLDGRHTASVQYAWGDVECDAHAASPRARTVSVTLPDGSAVSGPVDQSREAGWPGCIQEDGTLTPIATGRFFPTHDRPATTRSAWDDVEVTSGPLRLAGAPGSTLRFDVTLEAHGHDVSLATCPDYVIGFYGRRPRIERHQLNCAGIPTTRGGVPYLPAGRPVTFAMEATAPAYSSPKVVWQIPVRSDASGPVIGGTFTP